MNIICTMYIGNEVNLHCFLNFNFKIKLLTDSIYINMAGNMHKIKYSTFVHWEYLYNWSEVWEIFQICISLICENNDITKKKNTI